MTDSLEDFLGVAFIPLGIFAFLVLLELIPCP